MISCTKRRIEIGTLKKIFCPCGDLIFKQEKSFYDQMTHVALIVNQVHTGS